MARLEDHLQYVAAQWLRDNKIPFCHVPNEGKRTARDGMRLVAMGLQKGVHDIIIPLDNAVTLWVELKTDSGKLDPPQIKWHDQIEERGHASHVIKTDSPRILLEQLESLILLYAPQTRIHECANTYPLDKQ